MYGMIKRGEGAGEIKVAQAAAYVAQVTDYHHGEVSMEGTIVGLAQDYTGSNNLNLLSPEGQFGSRLTKESASSRYIFTKLHDNFRKVFPKADNTILEYQYSDGQQIEPKMFLPIIPTLLVNGADGIGTGFACKILNYNPKDLKRYVKAKVEGKKSPKVPDPWWDGFNGTVERLPFNRVKISGVLKVVNTTTIEITELPIGTFLETYKGILNGLEDDGFIRSYDDASTEEGFRFEIKCPRTTTALSHEKLLAKFKLVTPVTENFTVWDETYNRIVSFEHVGDLIDHFVEFRLARYEDRRLQTIIDWQGDLDWLEEKLRFVEFYLKNTDKFTKKTKDQLFTLLEKEGFSEIDKLLSQKIYSLTGDEITKLKGLIKAKNADIKGMQSTTSDTMYINEINSL